MEILYIWIEGNIGAGKSTFMDRVVPGLAAAIEAGDPGSKVVAVPEPVALWQSIPTSGQIGCTVRERQPQNVLHAFYADQKKYAYLFQTLAMTTRIDALQAAIDTVTKATRVYVIAERSLFTDRHVFIESLHASGTISTLEYDVYASTWSSWISRLYPGTHYAVVYLRADPEWCAARIASRARSEESRIPLEYLTRLHDLHETVLGRGVTSPWSETHRVVLDVATLGNIPDDDRAVTSVVATAYQRLEKSRVRVDAA